MFGTTRQFQYRCRDCGKRHILSGVDVARVSGNRCVHCGGGMDFVKYKRPSKKKVGPKAKRVAENKERLARKQQFKLNIARAKSRSEEAERLFKERSNPQINTNPDPQS